MGVKPDTSANSATACTRCARPIWSAAGRAAIARARCSGMYGSQAVLIRLASRQRAIHLIRQTDDNIGLCVIPYIDIAEPDTWIRQQVAGVRFKGREMPIGRDRRISR